MCVPSDETEFFDAALQFVGPLVRVPRGDCGEPEESVRVLRDRLRQLIVRRFGDPCSYFWFELFHTRGHERNHGYVYSGRVHAPESLLTQIGQLVSYAGALNG